MCGDLDVLILWPGYSLVAERSFDVCGDLDVLILWPGHSLVAERSFDVCGDLDNVLISWPGHSLVAERSFDVWWFRCFDLMTRTWSSGRTLIWCVVI